MKTPLFFLTTNVDKFEEIADLLAEELDVEIERRTARLPPPPSSVPSDVARFRALEAFKVLRAPVFAEALAIEMPDGALSGASFRQAFEMPEGAAWVKKHDGQSGIARIAVGYTADGKDARCFEVAIRGTLSAKPRGDGNAAWEGFWIPEGHTETLAELAGPDADELQNAPYVELVEALR